MICWYLGHGRLDSASCPLSSVLIFLKLPASRTLLQAAIARQLPRLRSILFKHILPNALTPVLVNATFGIAGAVTAESSLSFLGVGVEPPTASWGSIAVKRRLANRAPFSIFGWPITCLDSDDFSDRSSPITSLAKVYVASQPDPKNQQDGVHDARSRNRPSRGSNLSNLLPHRRGRRPCRRWRLRFAVSAAGHS